MNFDLPLIWAGLIATAVLLYVVLDGFDLGIGVLYPFARSENDRDVMMNSIAPVWDGNETWLVLGGAACWRPFRWAYAVLMPAFYLPVLLMLMGRRAAGRGVRVPLPRTAPWQDGLGDWPSGGAPARRLFPGPGAGRLHSGRDVEGYRFAGGPFDWLTPYNPAGRPPAWSAGYALLGAGWLILKTDDELHGDARRWGWISGAVVTAALAGVSLATLTVHPRVAERWGVSAAGLDLDRLLPLLAIPGLGLIGLAVLVEGLRRRTTTTSRSSAPF
jgi:cytochrome d ubiquinol oxidase subunit II